MKFNFPHTPILPNLNWNNSNVQKPPRTNHLLMKIQLALVLTITASCFSTHPLRITQTRPTSLRKSSSLSRSLSRRMSERRLSSEAHLRFCRTVSVRFPVSWQNLNKWDRFAQTWERPAGGVARGLGGLNHKEWVRLTVGSKPIKIILVVISLFKQLHQLDVAPSLC